MVNISNLKINEGSNLERPNLHVTTVENKNWKNKALKFVYIKEYRMDEQFQDLLIF